MGDENMLAISSFSILWLLCGFIAVMTMLSILGGKPEESSRSKLKWAHRVFGGIFSIVYLVFTLLMIPKYQGNSPFLSSSIATHAYLAVVLFPILFVKHYIVRIAKRYYPALPYIGITILAIAFLIVAITGLNHIILWTKVPKMTVQSKNGPRIVSTAIGRDLMGIKCARCHNLGILYKSIKKEKGWRMTIERMHNYDKALSITEDQIDHMVGYLLLKR